MKRISRRNFLKAAGVGAAALSLAACGGAASSTASSTASSAASAAAEDVTIKVAAIETGYGAEMWKKVTEAFTAQTGIKVEPDHRQEAGGRHRPLHAGRRLPRRGPPGHRP